MIKCLKSAVITFSLAAAVFGAKSKAEIKKAVDEYYTTVKNELPAKYKEYEAVAPKYYTAKEYFDLAIAELKTLKFLEVAKKANYFSNNLNLDPYPHWDFSRAEKDPYNFLPQLASTQKQLIKGTEEALEKMKTRTLGRTENIEAVEAALAYYKSIPLVTEISPSKTTKMIDSVFLSVASFETNAFAKMSNALSASTKGLRHYGGSSIKKSGNVHTSRVYETILGIKFIAKEYRLTIPSNLADVYVKKGGYISGWFDYTNIEDKVYAEGYVTKVYHYKANAAWAKEQRLAINSAPQYEKIAQLPNIVGQNVEDQVKSINDFATAFGIPTITVTKPASPTFTAAADAYKKFTDISKANYVEQLVPLKIKAMGTYPYDVKYAPVQVYKVEGAEKNLVADTITSATGVLEVQVEPGDYEVVLHATSVTKITRGSLNDMDYNEKNKRYDIDVEGMVDPSKSKKQAATGQASSGSSASNEEPKKEEKAPAKKAKNKKRLSKLKSLL